MSNRVLSTLIAQGKINIVPGQLPGHANAFATYALQTNTLTLNTALIAASADPSKNLRNAMMEETFHAYQYVIYGDRFNQRCYEFEAKVYGTIVINQYDPSSIGTRFINPMNEDTTPRYIKETFASDVNRMTEGFTHGISNDDVNTLYQTYGPYCTQYPEGDPNWEFKAIKNAQNN